MTWPEVEIVCVHDFVLHIAFYVKLHASSRSGYVTRLIVPPLATSAPFLTTTDPLFIQVAFSRNRLRTHKEQPGALACPLLSVLFTKARLFSTSWKSPLTMSPPHFHTTFFSIVPFTPTLGGFPASKRRPNLGLE